MKKSLTIALTIGAIGIALVSTTAAFHFYSENQKTISAITSEQDRLALKKEALQFLSKEQTPEELETYLLDIFPDLEAADCTEIVDTYIYGIYNTCSQFTLTDDETNLLSRYIVADGKFDLSGLEDEKLKQTIKERSNDHIVLRYLNGSMYWDVDYGYIYNTFGKFLNADYRDVIGFYAMEREKSYQDETEMKLYTDIVIDRLESAYHLLTTYPDSEIVDFMQDSYYFYKAIYLGAYSQDSVFNDGKVREELFESYQSYAKTCSDPEFSSFLEELISDYLEVDRTRTIPIYEKIKDFCGFYVADATPSTTELAQ